MNYAMAARSRSIHLEVRKPGSLLNKKAAPERRSFD